MAKRAVQLLLLHLVDLAEGIESAGYRSGVYIQGLPGSRYSQRLCFHDHQFMQTRWGHQWLAHGGAKPLPTHLGCCT